MFHRLRPALRLLADTGGNVLVFSAIGMLVIAALIGGAVDLGFTYKAQNRLQGACDAAILAGRKAVGTNGYDTAAQAQATTYFNANFVPAEMGTTGTSFSSSSPDSGTTIAGTAQATVPLRIMPLFGRRNITITANCSATMGIANTDITFVLDTTGSMNDTPTGFTTTKIAALQSALKSFYTTMSNSVAGTTARVRYAFVPYSSSVNVGRLLYNLNPAYIVDSYGIQSRVPRFETTLQGKFAGRGNNWYTISQQVYNSTPNGNPVQLNLTAYSSQAACLAAAPADTIWITNGLPSTQITTTWMNTSFVTTTITRQPMVMTAYTCARSGDSYYIWYYNAYMSQNTYVYAGLTAPTQTQTVTTFDHWDYELTNVDTSVYKTFASTTTTNGSSGTSQTSTWAGCIEERNTSSAASFAYDAASARITPTAATDLDIDSAPTSNDATKWAPMWPEMVYYRGDSWNIYDTPVMTSGVNTSSFCPAASQLLATMTQTAFNTYVDSLVAAGSTYHDFGMAWGARLSSPDGIFRTNVTTTPSNGGRVTRHIIFMTDGEQSANPYIQTMNGIEYHDKRVTDDGWTDNDTRHTSRFMALCDAVKAKGIRIWVIGYTTALTSNLSYCASPSSSFLANNVADLNTAFQTIARQVGELRVTG